jgi:hypothetical protein
MQPKTMRQFVNLVIVAAGLVLTAGTWTLAVAQALDPMSVSATIKPGDSFDVSKHVTTPLIPPKPDICFLADTTGSMGTAIANVKANATAIMDTIRASQADSQFCAAEYKDVGDVFTYRLNQDVTPTIADAQTGAGAWSASGGGDEAEAQLNALSVLASTASWRPGSTRIIVWFGDAPGHDPSNGATLASTIAALQAADVKVIALSVGFDRLDLFGQATAITAATAGVFAHGINQGAVTAAILAGLNALPTTVSMASNCVATTGGAISTSFVPASQVVTSGETATFTETITVSLGAVQGSTYVCTDHAILNGSPMTDAAGNLIVETKTITVEDITAPSARCVQGVNPAGNIPAAGNNPKSGQNPDGFYQLLASDNVGIASVVVCDGGSSFCSNLFQPNDYVKITQAQGATPGDERPGPGVLVSHLKLKGDAVLTVTDTSGHVTTAACLVPAPPK